MYITEPPLYTSFLHVFSRHTLSLSTLESRASAENFPGGAKFSRRKNVGYAVPPS